MRSRHFLEAAKWLNYGAMAALVVTVCLWWKEEADYERELAIHHAKEAAELRHQLELQEAAHRPAAAA